MASLLSLFSGSGTPSTLTDDEAEALQQQQQQQQQQAQQAQSDPTSGVSALMGVSGPDSTSQDAQPVADATRQGLLNYLGQGASKDAGSDANPSYATDSQKADEAAAQTAQDDASNAPADSSSADTSSDAASSDAGNNRAAVENLLLHPQRLGDAIQALDKHAADTKAVKENLISKVKGVQKTGGLLGAIAAGQVANKSVKDQRKK